MPKRDLQDENNEPQEEFPCTKRARRERFNETRRLSYQRQRDERQRIENADNERSVTDVLAAERRRKQDFQDTIAKLGATNEMELNAVNATDATETDPGQTQAITTARPSDIGPMSPTVHKAKTFLRQCGFDMTPENMALALDYVKQDDALLVAAHDMRTKHDDQYQYRIRTNVMAVASLKRLRQCEEHHNENFELKQQDVELKQQDVELKRQDVKSKEQWERVNRLLANYVILGRWLAGALCVLAIACALRHHINGIVENVCPYIEYWFPSQLISGFTKSVSLVGIATVMGFVWGRDNSEAEKEEGCIISTLWVFFLLVLFAGVMYVLPPFWKNLTACAASIVALIWMMTDTTNKIIASVLSLLTIPFTMCFGWFVHLLYKELDRSSTAEEMKAVVDRFEDRASLLFFCVIWVVVGLVIAFFVPYA